MAQSYNRLLGGVAAVCVRDSGLVLAAAATDQHAVEVETVVVTASDVRRTSSAFPSPITALQARPSETQASRFRSGMRVPSLRFAPASPAGEVITMRGLGSQNTTPGGDSPWPTTSTALRAAHHRIDREFYDINRIEVRAARKAPLRRNSVGGRSIVHLTSRPHLLGGARRHVRRLRRRLPRLVNGP